ncbi:hypothetical protein OQX61_00080 [Pedobacter sp. PLR]|uniref:hypothetical protein n=1 Tax=Pedobacter sp. PLR TaxID=2994465 RepID=UPI002245A311|nr:hypothetical protein [Pedobacter sp. PLR]MCX2449653.1 hypothetical protein [Pedobacter sp. PLR]
MGQTSWKGTVSSSWNNSANWTAGIPNSATDATIGDANFTGSFQPTVNVSSTCKSLTIGAGTGSPILTQNKGLSVAGNLTIASSGRLNQAGVTLTVKGNWSNSGIFSANQNNSKVTFGGTSQSIGGSNSTTFRRLTINAGSTVVMNINTVATGAVSVGGTFMPTENVTAFRLSGAGSLSVGVNGVLRVNAATFALNYALTGSVTLAAGSTVDYNATLVNQTIRENLSYSILRISGAGVKTPAGNLLSLNSTTATAGNINVSSGTLDLSTFTANRGTTVAGGTFTVANGATLRIGGTNTFPLNYGTHSLSLTSTVQYSGTTQVVANRIYGNLILSSSTGAAVKTMPATALTVTGDFSSTLTTGTSVSFTATSNISVRGSLNIGASTVFNGGSFLVEIAGNWVNNGTFTGGTGMVNLSGAGSSISGTGTHNFNDLSISASNITANAASALNITGNLSSTGPGSFSHATGGSLMMSGTAKTIAGTGFIFSNLTISGTISSSSNLIITGNLSVSNSFTNTNNTVAMSGTGNNISGAGFIGFSGLSVTGNITTASNFSVAGSVDVIGSFTASAGTATFTGTNTLNGTANLFNVTLNGTSLQLSTNAVLGISGAYVITSGALNVTSTTPNTVNYNGSGAQTVVAGNYGNLILSNGSTKTAGGAINVSSDLTIAASTTFNASSFSHTISGNWTTTGTFTAATSTVQFTGIANASITGVSTFNILTINKTAATNLVDILSNVTVNTLNMTNGSMSTGNNIINILSNRTGNGIILGTIRHTHSFNSGTAYAFEGPNNTITFNGLNVLLTAVTVTVTKGSISDFPFGGSANLVYNVVLTGTAVSAATLRLHYEDADLNGNNESTIRLWHYNGASWGASGKTTNSATANYVEQILLLNVSNRWTLSDDANLVRWNGSVSSDWFTAANWTTVQGAPSLPPSADDIVEIGATTFVNQPVINGSAVAKSITFGSTKAVTLSVTGGSLTTQGNINGSWGGLSTTHTININNQNLIVNGDLSLSDGTAGHVINLNMGSGTTTVAGSLSQSGGANVTFTGAGTLNIGAGYNYLSGTFTPSGSTVVYNGSSAQSVAGINYNNLSINKTAGIAAINSPTTIAGNLSVTTGELDINSPASISGNVTVASGAILNGDGITTTVGGNWINNGTFLSLSGTILLNGAGPQSISSTTFNNLTINKPGSTATLTGNISINGAVTFSAGTLDLSTFTLNRSGTGGTFTASGGTNILLSGANNFPSNFGAYNIDLNSTVTFNGTVAQTVPAVTLGNIVFANSGVKTLTGPLTANGNLTINSGSNFGAGAHTINLGGNFVNNGTFNSGTGTLVLNGSGKTISGNTIFNRVTVYGGYGVAGSDITYNGLLFVTASGSFDGGSGTATLNGDLTNSGSLVSNGVTTFSGTQVQIIRFLNAITSNSSGVINFNGNVSPVLNSTSPPVFATLNVNNTAGINPSVGWTVAVAFNISLGAKFNGGNPTHNILGSFTNEGTVTSSGIMNYAPAAARTIKLAGTSFTSTGTVIFGGSGAMNVTGIPAGLNNVKISNTAGVSPAADWNIAGTFSIANNAIFNAGSNSYTVGGDIESDGTLNGGTSVFTMSSAAAELSGSPGTTFYDLVITGIVLSNSDFNVSHNFTNNNSFDASMGALIMTGAGASTVGGTASPFPLAQFAISKSSGGTVTLTKDITEVTDLHILSGTLDASTFSITQDIAGGSLVIDDNSFLKIGGTNTLPTFASYALDTLSTVEYNGGIQAISSATTYGKLSISTAGTKTASAALHTLSDFALANGTFVPGSFTDIIEGNWNMTSGTFTNTGNTIVLSGSTAQLVSSTGAFNNLTINKTTAFATLSSNVTVNGVLNFAAGKIKTGSNRVIIPATGNVTSASQATGWVYGKLQKNIATGTNVTRIFEVGDSISYTPATVLFAAVSTAGNLSSVVFNTDHPNLATSGISAGSSVNRYWSFSNTGTVFSTASVTVNWIATDLDPGTVTANLRVSNFNGSTWSQPAVTSPLPASIQATGLSFIGDIAVGAFAGITSWTGALSVDWYTTGNWSSGFVPINTSDVIIPSGLSNYPTINIGTATGKNFTIQAGAALTVNNGILQIGGSISNTGSFTVSNGTVELNGATAQNLPSSVFAGNMIRNLTVNNSAGVTLGGTLNLTGILLVSSGQLNTGGYLSLVSSPTQTALIDGSGTGNVSGNVTMQRYLAAGFGYKYFSSAVQSATVSSFASTVDLNAVFPNFYTYIENQASTGFKAYTTSTNPLVPMQGYAADFGSSTAPKMVSIIGVVNNGTLSSTLYNHNQPYSKGFNLVGNPYPSPIDWNASTGWTKTNIDNAVYFFKSGTTSQYTGVYSTYINGVSSDGIAGNIIASMQGFFIHVSDGAYPVTATLAMNNIVRVNDLSPVFHKSMSSFADHTAKNPRILLRLSAKFSDQEQGADPLVIYTSGEASPVFDKKLDAIKLMNLDDQVPNLYSVGADASKLVINSLPDLDSLTVIPLGLENNRNGTVIFNLQNTEQWPEHLRIFLNDGATGAKQDLRTNPVYRTNVSSGSHNNRFSLSFTGTENVVGSKDEYTVFGSAGALFVRIKLASEQKGTLVVSNAIGQVISRSPIPGNGEYPVDSRVNSGFYIISFITPRGAHSKKVFLENK